MLYGIFEASVSTKFHSSVMAKFSVLSREQASILSVCMADLFDPTNNHCTLHLHAKTNGDQRRTREVYQQRSV